MLQTTLSKTPLNPLKSIAKTPTVRLIALPLLMLFAPMLANAAPTQSSLNQLADVMPYDNLFFSTIVAPLAEERQILAYNLASNSALNDSERQNAILAYDNYVDGLIKAIDTPATKNTLKNAYINAAKNYSQAEVDALLAFYGSSAGKSAIQKSEQIMAEYLNASLSSVASIADNYRKTHLGALETTLKQTLDKQTQK